MPKEHVVRQGDCISSIAAEHGYFPDTLWDAPANEELRARRKDPQELVPGDVIVLPDKKVVEYSRPTGARHELRRRGIPAVLRLQLFRDGKPRASEDYVLEVDRLPVIEGKTDSDGVLTENLPPRAVRGKLTVGADRDPIVLSFGVMDPPSELSGIQKRLRNIGFYEGLLDGKPSPALAKALRAFQSLIGIERTGEADEETVERLIAMHDAKGSVAAPGSSSS